jgi:hypothetical protein
MTFLILLVNQLTVTKVLKANNNDNVLSQTSENIGENTN